MADGLEELAAILTLISAWKVKVNILSQNKSNGNKRVTAETKHYVFV